jgi:hypothetical protein
MLLRISGGEVSSRRDDIGSGGGATHSSDGGRDV